MKDDPQIPGRISMNVLGVVRNGGPALKETLLCVERLRTRLDGSTVTIATNDNTDDTDRVLADYQSSFAEVQVLRMDGLADRCPERVDRIAAARNAVLKQIEGTETFRPLTLVLDLDGPNASLDPGQVLRAAKRQSPDWDAVFANSYPAYYDLYALRRVHWCETDPWQEVISLPRPRMLRSVWWRRVMKRHIYKRQFRIPPDTPLIEVDSAFCGLGLYRTAALRGVEYGSRDANGEPTCEHVILHAAMRAQGSRLFIDPGLLTLGPSEHLGPGSGRPIPKTLLA